MNSQIQDLRGQLAALQSELDKNTANYRVQITSLQAGSQQCEQTKAQLQKQVEDLSRNNNVVSNLQTENRTLTQRILVLTQDAQNCQQQLSATQRIQQERDNCLSNLTTSRAEL